MNMPWQDPRVQRGMKALLQSRRERSDAGDTSIGWKIAFGPKAIQQKLGINGPLVGFMAQSRAVQSGETVSLAGWTRPVVEPEIAVVMGSDLGAGAGRDAAAAAIARMGPAFELIDAAVPPEDPEKVLQGNIAFRHVVLGPAASVTPEQMQARVFRNGAEVASTAEVQAMPGDPRALVAYVADYLGAFGETLRAGETLICGSIVPPIAIDATDETLRYVLDPVGEVSVRFTR